MSPEPLPWQDGAICYYLSHKTDEEWKRPGIRPHIVILKSCKYGEQAGQSFTSVDPFTPKSYKHVISLHNITPQSHIEVMRILRKWSPTKGSLEC